MVSFGGCPKRERKARLIFSPKDAVVQDGAEVLLLLHVLALVFLHLQGLEDARAPGLGIHGVVFLEDLLHQLRVEGLAALIGVLALDRPDHFFLVGDGVFALEVDGGHDELAEIQLPFFLAAEGQVPEDLGGGAGGAVHVG